MANRALQSKVEREKHRAWARAKIAAHNRGENPRWAGCGDLVDEVPAKPWDLHAVRAKNVELPPNVEVKRIPCTGTMPQGGVSRLMRKARGGPVELWTGGKQRANRNHVAPAGRGMFLTNAVYEPNAEWKIVKR